LKAALINVAAVVGKFSRTRKRQKNKNFIVGRFESLFAELCQLRFQLYGVNDPPFEKALVAGVASQEILRPLRMPKTYCSGL